LRPRQQSRGCYTTLPSKGIKTVPHPFYSPDIAPCDFYLYSQGKKEINGRGFETEIEAVKALETLYERLPARLRAVATHMGQRSKALI
jgi:hypothetical protein